MYDYDNDEFYYEPTMADEIFNRAKKELEDSLKEEIKSQIKSTMDYNFRLRQENEDLKQQVRNLDNRERDLNNRELQFERTALRKVFSELLKPLEDRMEVYMAETEWFMEDKCYKCNEKRELPYKSPTGKDVVEKCKCSKSYSIYVPKLVGVSTITLGKDHNKTEFRYSAKYCSKNYDNDYCTVEVSRFIDDINDIVSMDTIHQYRDGFKTKEDCKKYCDWLNKSKNNVPKRILDKVGK